MRDCRDCIHYIKASPMGICVAADLDEYPERRLLFEDGQQTQFAQTMRCVKLACGEPAHWFRGRGDDPMRMVDVAIQAIRKAGQTG